MFLGPKCIFGTNSYMGFITGTPSKLVLFQKTWWDEREWKSTLSTFISRCEKEYPCAQIKSLRRLISIKISFQLSSLSTLSHPIDFLHFNIPWFRFKSWQMNWNPNGSRIVPRGLSNMTRKGLQINPHQSTGHLPNTSLWPQPNPASECPCLPLPSSHFLPLLLLPSAGSQLN